MVTGSRELQSKKSHDFIWRVLTEEAIKANWHVVLIHGQSPAGGADEAADLWGREHVGFGVNVIPFPPNTERYGWVQSMHIRNQAMVDMGPDLVIGFLCASAENKGTKSTLKRARAAKLKVVEYTLDE
jgi:hypothetical protein